MSTLLKLIAGETEIDLNDGSNYELLAGWTPRVARRRRSVLGGRGVYEDVVESIPLRVFGATTAAALAALRALALALEQADRWRNGEDVAAVVLRYQPHDSSLSDPLQVAVLGLPDGAEDLLALPQTFNRDLQVYEINPVYVELVRRGTWLSSATSKTVAATSNPAILTADMGAALTVPGPTKVTLTGIDASTPLIGDAYVLFTDISPQSTYGRNLALYLAAEMGSSEFGSVDDSANNAAGDDVMRIDAAANQSGSLTLSEVAAEVKEISIFIAVRNNSGAVWKVRARSTGYSTTVGRWYVIDADASQPRPMYIGTLISAYPSHYNVVIDVETEAGSGTLDINYAVVFPHGDASQIVAIIGDTYNDEAYERVMQIDHRALTHDTPLLYVEAAE